MKNINIYYLFVLLVFAISSLSSCAPDFKDISSANGRRAVIEQAQNFMTASNCGEAINILRPLYESQYVDDEVRFVYAGAYACQGGFSFTSLVAALADSSGSDIWSQIVKSNHSKSASDGHLTSLKRAAELLRQTSSVKDKTDGNHFQARFRTSEANMYMIFLQSSIIGTVISKDTMGNAYVESGKKRQNITGLGSSDDLCSIQVAFSTIYDSLQYVNSSGLTKIGGAVNSVCGGTCTGNLNPDVCTAVETALGTAQVAAIDSQWTRGP